MFWSKPRDKHIIYEALSAIADNRFEMTSENTAKCTSTSNKKFYEIEFDPKTNSIMSNDNMAFYVNEVSYPMVAFLLIKGVIEYDEKVLERLKGVKWKQINQKNKNDYMKSVKEVLNDLAKKGYNVVSLEKEVDRIYDEVLKLELKILGVKKAPPKAY